MTTSLRRRALSVALVAAATAGVVTGTTSPAAAARYTYLQPTSFARTDNQAPNTTITTGDALVGAHQGSVSKSYFTFDVTRFTGKQVVRAVFGSPELAANDCATPPATEVWLTKPPRQAPTWARAPKEILRLPQLDGATGCPRQNLAWDAREAIAKAVAEGWDTMTVVVRITRGKQRDPAYGRTFASRAGMTAYYNTAPNTPTDLRVNYGSCGAWIPNTDLELSGAVSDPDGDWPLTARIAYWPVADPAARVEKTTQAYSSFRLTVPNAELTDGAGYEWQVRVEDADGLVSPWSDPCGFTIDKTRPSAAPTVSSDVYPPNGGPPGGGGPRIAGDFTFTANGVSDVVAFGYDGICMPYGRVDADQPGGSATVSLAPRSSGPCDLTVWSVDRAGNRSNDAYYRFWVRSSAPEVTVPETLELGERLPATLTARQYGATTFVYQMTDQSEEATVPVDEDGTVELLLDVPPNEHGYYLLRVWTETAEGVRSEAGGGSFRVDMVPPTITLPPGAAPLDEPVEVTFRPNTDGIVSYTYWIDEGERATVRADAEGTARAMVTPPGGDGYRVYAFGTTASGLNTGIAEAYGTVGSAPVVTSAEYPNGVDSGAPGTPGTFHFAAPIPHVVEYRYQFNWGEEVTVPAAADGTATMTLTPPGWGRYTLRVYAVSATGRTTAVTVYTVAVNPVPPVVEGAPTTPVADGIQLELVFTAQQPGAVEFVYADRWGTERTVAAVDGKATVTITVSDPNDFGRDFLTVQSRTPDGYRSAPRRLEFLVTTS